VSLRAAAKGTLVCGNRRAALFISHWREIGLRAEILSIPFCLTVFFLTLPTISVIYCTELKVFLFLGWFDLKKKTLINNIKVDRFIFWKINAVKTKSSIQSRISVCELMM